MLYLPRYQILRWSDLVDASHADSPRASREFEIHGRRYSTSHQHRTATQVDRSQNHTLPHVPCRPPDETEIPTCQAWMHHRSPDRTPARASPHAASLDPLLP